MKGKFYLTVADLKGFDVQIRVHNYNDTEYEVLYQVCCYCVSIIMPVNVTCNIKLCCWCLTVCFLSFSAAISKKVCLTEECVRTGNNIIRFLNVDIA
jgi:hypothetical protein